MKQLQSAKVQRYLALVNKLTPKSDLSKCLVRSFWVGGVICVLGQCILLAATGPMRLAKKRCSRVYLHRAGVSRLAADGALAFMTASANMPAAAPSCPSPGLPTPSLQAQWSSAARGLVMGVGARMFQIAGPVLVYGIGSSVLVGRNCMVGGGAVTMAELMGKQTAKLQHPPQVESFAACVGKKEGEGPLGTLFDAVHRDDTLGQENWKRPKARSLPTP